MFESESGCSVDEDYSNLCAFCGAKLDAVWNSILPFSYSLRLLYGTALTASNGIASWIEPRCDNCTSCFYKTVIN
jgi:hypothetical protein